MFEKTFFVLAPSFHGATLLSKLINAHPELTALGDTYPSNRFDQVCGCGERVSQCPFWNSVKAAVGARRYARTRGMLPQYPGEKGGRVGRFLFSDFTSFWATPRMLRMVSGHHLAGFRADYEAFLAAVYEHTPQPGRIFVDGLKFNTRVAALVAAGFPVDGIVHLYRDPVDFVNSSIRNTGRGGWAGMVEHALRYRLYHARARQVGYGLPGLTLSYEALADDVDERLERLFAFLGVQPMTVAQLRPYFEQEWHFMGNASLLAFNGVIQRGHHNETKARRGVIRALAGSSQATSR